MNHSFLEPGMWRVFRDGWNAELAWGVGFCWFGFKYQQSRDGERGRMVSLGLWWLKLYLTFTGPRDTERVLGLWFDDQHLCAQLYRGDDEMNAMPWMWEWPWKRWHHMRCDQIEAEREYAYRYERQDGTVQEVVAAVTVEEREWRWIWRWNPLRIRVRRYIDVRFSDEIGERTGSWKGGVLGCGYDMLPGEDALGALRRMERERRFT